MFNQPNALSLQVSIRRLPGLELRFADPHACQLCTSIVPEPILPVTASSNASVGLFSRPVFRKMSVASSSTAAPAASSTAPRQPLRPPVATTGSAASSLSSGERSPPPGPFALFVGGSEGAAGVSAELVYGGGSRTCSQMVIAFRYLLPRLLLMPIYQILYLADLLDVSTSLVRTEASIAPQTLL